MKPTAKTFLHNGINYVIKNMIFSCLQTGCSFSPQKSATRPVGHAQKASLRRKRDNIWKLEMWHNFQLSVSFNSNASAAGSDLSRSWSESLEFWCCCFMTQKVSCEDKIEVKFLLEKSFNVSRVTSLIK